MPGQVNWDKVREYVQSGRLEEVLAALGFYPYTTRFTKQELEKIREELGITQPTASLLSLIISFILDVLMPPPFKPPLALLLNLIGSLG